MRYLHTMIRVTHLDRSLDFYTKGLGFEVVSKNEYPDGKFTLVFLRAPGDGSKDSPMIELTYNWGTEKYERGDAYGHTAYAVDSIAEVQAKLKKHGYDLSWGPGKLPTASAPWLSSTTPTATRSSFSKATNKNLTGRRLWVVVDLHSCHHPSARTLWELSCPSFFC